PATVVLRGGLYERHQTLALTGVDSGSEEAPVTYRAAPEETPRLVGGRIVPAWEPVQDPAVLTRLPEAARPHVRQCDLRALGVTDLGGLASRGFGRPTTPAHLELFFQGRRMELARWPNDEFARIERPAALEPEGDGHGGQLGKLEDGFLFAGDRPSTWRSLDDVWLHGYWAWDWANSYERLTSWDPASGLIRTAPPHGLYGIKPGQRFYFLNVLEELDRPGEYYVDRAAGLLYFWPPDPPAGNDAAVSVLEGPLVEIREAGHLRFEGLVLECSRGIGVQISGGTAVTLAGCTLRCLGNHAVVVDGGQDHAVVSCDLYELGDGGIRLSGGDRKTLTPARHRAVNNRIHHLAQWSRCYQPGVLVQGVGNQVAHNLIHDHPHCAVLLNGNDHVVEYNHLHHVCQETGDVGAFYMGRDWTERGNVVRYNLFHHTQGVGMGSMAVYLDDCASGTSVYGNVFYRCTRAAFIGGGRDHRVENNLFIECHPAVMIDGRGLDRRQVWHDMVYLTMRERLEGMNHHLPPYRDRYPELAQLDPYYAADDGVPPEGNRLVRNVAWRGEWLQVHWHAEPGMLTTEGNLTGIDPLIVDPEAGDFRLRPDSPALAAGFTPIPLDRIGLYHDAYRSEVPAVGWR
ncbi:MAG: right-handed parallel beta-helix repeat-containing protein, partial [Candidatus Latescibacterota bacterium]